MTRTKPVLQVFSLLALVLLTLGMIWPVIDIVMFRLVALAGVLSVLLFAIVLVVKRRQPHEVNGLNNEAGSDLHEVSSNSPMAKILRFPVERLPNRFTPPFENGRVITLASFAKKEMK